MSILRSLLRGNARLVDFGDGSAASSFADILRAQHSELTPIDINNVAEYIYAGNEREEWGVSDVPVSSPPLQWMWFEFHRPTAIKSDKNPAASVDTMPAKTAALVYGEEMKPHEFSIPPHVVRSGWPPATFVRRWRALSYQIVEARPGVFAVSPLLSEDSVDESGSLRCIEHRLLTSPSGASMDDFARAKEAADWIWRVAVSFMHCKNVTLEVESVPAWRRAGTNKKRRVVWRTLSIEPFKAVARAENGGNAPQPKQALHICRGHFKDFRESGLFGKIKGVFWWAQHVRGSAEAGVVKHDYKIKL